MAARLPDGLREGKNEGDRMKAKATGAGPADALAPPDPAVAAPNPAARHSRRPNGRQPAAGLCARLTVGPTNARKGCTAALAAPHNPAVSSLLLFSNRPTLEFQLCSHATTRHCSTSRHLPVDIFLDLSVEFCQR